MSLSKERKGEIAELLLAFYLKKHPDEIQMVEPNEFRRGIGNIAKEINVPLKELFEFIEPLIREIFQKKFDEVFRKD